eukprot:GGOE01020945.1.p1 GENE.GGOE01020945.1~~GGOE01020945.1.p1  ORF type:complete len:375 (+),score=108.34 GGOE01020945.1:99-1223(+)
MAYFQLLGLPKTCYESDVLKAFRAYSLRWHPQRNRALDAIGKFAEVCEAYQILIDPRFKSVYERLGAEGPRFEGFTPSAPDTVFRGFWRKYGGEEIVQQYLAQGGDSVEEPGDFLPTIEKLEAIHKFKEMYKGDVMPEINPWRPNATPTAGASLSGASIREQMMAQWRQKQGPSTVGSPGSAGGAGGSRRQVSAMGRPRDVPDPKWSPAEEDSRVGISPHTRVLLVGLHNASHHNGKTGLVEGISGDRYTVTLDDGSSLNVRPPNLVQMPKVRILGNVEDDRGVVVGFDADTQRYEVQTALGAIVSAKPANIVLCNHTCVMIMGLADAAQYNGKWGKVLDFDADTGRYLVKLDDKAQLRVRLDNARIATPPLVA